MDDQLCIIRFHYDNGFVGGGRNLKYINGSVEDFTSDLDKSINEGDEDEGIHSEYYDSDEFGGIVSDEDMFDDATKMRSRMTQFVLTDLYTEKIVRDHFIKVTNIQDQIRSKNDLWVNASMIRRAKKMNKGSTVKMVVHGTTPSSPPVFQRFYICFKALEKGMENGCKSFWGLDGCWLKSLTQEITKKTMMTIIKKKKECIKWRGGLGPNIWKIIENNGTVASKREVAFNGDVGVLRGNVEDIASSWYHKDVYMVAYASAFASTHASNIASTYAYASAHGFACVFDTIASGSVQHSAVANASISVQTPRQIGMCFANDDDGRLYGMIGAGRTSPLSKLIMLQTLLVKEQFLMKRKQKG
ncbi:Uncharacterized protein TCM_033707 [Theobroma cacao]|uniref:Uncharacterized protein n=1 Tax=Theobroma cacao TaxID=3641 RepID=A0A061FAF5_THECC|nr:Uncharacterized protein TCM_033707 [Theobroma cacao]